MTDNKARDELGDIMFGSDPNMIAQVRAYVDSRVKEARIEEAKLIKTETEYRLNNDLQLIGEFRTIKGLDSYIAVIPEERIAALTDNQERSNP